jgi:hypothetical protein
LNKIKKNNNSTTSHVANELLGIGIFETPFIRLRIEATSHPDYKTSATFKDRLGD